MAQVTMKGTPVNTSGELPTVGSDAKDFNLVGVDLSNKSMEDYKGQNVIMNIFPSVDTGTCATSVRNFNKKAAELDNTKVLCISRDLPFAQSRFCGAEGLDNVEMLSDFRAGAFGDEYGLNFVDGPFTGLSSRCVVVVNADGKIVHTEQVGEIVDEPNYEAALNSL